MCKFSYSESNQLSNIFHFSIMAKKFLENYIIEKVVMRQSTMTKDVIYLSKCYSMENTIPNFIMSMTTHFILLSIKWLSMPDFLFSRTAFNINLPYIKANLYLQLYFLRYWFLTTKINSCKNLNLCLCNAGNYILCINITSTFHLCYFRGENISHFRKFLFKRKKPSV